MRESLYVIFGYPIYKADLIFLCVENILEPQYIRYIN